MNNNLAEQIQNCEFRQSMTNNIEVAFIALENLYALMQARKFNRPDGIELRIVMIKRMLKNMQQIVMDEC